VRINKAGMKIIKRKQSEGSEGDREKRFSRSGPKKVIRKDHSGGDRPSRKPYIKRDSDSDRSERKPYRSDDQKRHSSHEEERRERNPSRIAKKPFKKTFEKERADRKPYRSDEKRKSGYGEERRERKDSDSPKKIIKRKESGNDREERKPYRNDEKRFVRKDRPSPRKSYSDRDEKPYNKERKSYADRDEKPYNKDQKIVKRSESSEREAPEKHYPKERKEYRKKPIQSRKPTLADEGLIRLNKYIATAGICSRREADELIASGAVSINGKVVTEMGIRVAPGDVVQYGGQTLKGEKNVYLLLNKPKDFITTSEDPMDRRTVMALVENACKERIYPVGRLDRNTTGVLLFTNDGDLSKALTHPKHAVKKIYHVVLDRSLTKADMVKIAEGFELDDGFAKVDEIAYVTDSGDKKQIGVELHSGRNRIVRRIFESLDYKVVKLDRVYFAGLTKKDMPRGKWRFLTTQEVNMLKMIS